MDSKKYKVVGIIGGMGPIATCELYKKIIDNTDALEDQEHLHILIDNYASIPNRTDAILYGGESPVSYIVESGKRLIAAGAEILVMACNTSHYFYDDIQNQLEVSLINIVEQTIVECEKKGFTKVALFATEGTIKTRIFQKYASEKLQIMIPNEEQQESITDVIYKGIKAGNKNFDTTGFRDTVAFFENNGAECVILGCTELPLAVENYKIKGNFFDPLEVISKKLIELAGGKVKE